MRENIENNGHNHAQMDFTLASSRTRTSNANSHEFKLIECEKYASDDAPFRVSISVEVLAIIDIHAHCSKTEVIGFLGGKYCNTFKELRILTAEPCAPISATTNTTEVEMDPVSAVEVAEKIRQAGLSVVGWYHSHPTFVPNPSLRDLRQHAICQNVYSQDNTFLALILSPYCCSSPRITTNEDLISDYKCLVVSDKTSTYGSSKYRIPYEFDPAVIRQEKLLMSVLCKTRSLITFMKGRKSTKCMVQQVIKGKDLTFADKVSYSFSVDIVLT